MAAPAPVCDWTGFYIGVLGGYGGGDLVWGDPGDNEILTHHIQNGFFGGGEIGYNHQFGSFLVLGAEGDFSASDIGASNVQVNTGEETKTFHTENDWTGTFALRAGISGWNNHLLSYIKGGVAVAHFNYNSINDERPGGSTNVDTFSTDETRVVPLVGCGMEYAFTCHWSAKAEYNHMFLGSEYASGTSIDDRRVENEEYSFELHQDSVKLGLNYKF